MVSYDSIHQTNMTNPYPSACANDLTNDLANDEASERRTV